MVMNVNAVCFLLQFKFSLVIMGKAVPIDPPDYCINIQELKSHQTQGQIL